MNWIPFTADHVKARLAARELEVYEATAGAEYPEEGGVPAVPADAVERLPAIVTQVLAQFRGVIRGNPRVTYVGPPGTLPDFCIAAAAVLGRVALTGLNPVPEGMTDPRREEYRSAERFLEELGKMAGSAFLEGDAGGGDGCAGGEAVLVF